MRVLFVTPYIPLSTKPRPFRFLERLARSHDVHLLAFDVSRDARYADRPDYQRLRQLCASITLVPLSRLERYANAAGSLLSPRPARVAYYGSAHRLAPTITELVDRHAIDVLHVDRLRLAPLAAHVPLPKIVDATDCISDYLRQCAHYVAPHLKPAYALEAAKTARFERHAAGAYDRCLVTTEREREQYGPVAYYDRVRVVPNILDARWFERRDETRTGGDPTILFAGNLSYLPNVDAIAYLARRIWPGVVRRLPRARLVLAGSAPTDRVRRLAGELGAEIPGFVPDLADVVAAATVVISPMRIGVGFPNKVAEALALGKAVVSTSTGCQGLAGSERALRVADGAEEFAEQVAWLARDDHTRRQLGRAGREYAHETLHPNRVATQFDAIYDAVLGERMARYALAGENMSENGGEVAWTKR